MFDDLPFMESKASRYTVHDPAVRLCKSVRGRPTAGTILSIGLYVAKLQLQVFGPSEEHFPHSPNLRTLKILKDRIVKEYIVPVASQHTSPVKVLEGRIKNLYQLFFRAHKKNIRD